MSHRDGGAVPADFLSANSPEGAATREEPPSPHPSPNHCQIEIWDSYSATKPWAHHGLPPSGLPALRRGLVRCTRSD
jgi:hypothetical protein